MLLIFKKIKAFINKMKHNASKDRCYSHMELRGIAALGMCSGIVGGDSNTEYLAYSCIDCPYFVGFKGE